jgi:hypothetical protein
MDITCSVFKFYIVFTLYIHVSLCASQRHAPIQLAFGIMTYQKQNKHVEETVSDFMRLMNHIYDENNHIYVLHNDLKSDPLLHERISNEFCKMKLNCISIQPRSVTWAGISVTEMNLALMQAADDFQYPNGTSSSWEYFFLLGHESVPLSTLQYTERFLLNYPKQTNFINCWKGDGYDFFGQYEDINHRISRTVVDSYDSNILHETNIERKVPHGIEIYKSIQYVVLSREFVRFACHGPETRRVLLFLANVKASDELLLPTLLQLNRTIANTATCDTTLHFTHWIRPGGSWHPEYLTIEHLPMLLNTTNYLFARKVDKEISAVLLLVLDKIRLEYNDHFPSSCDTESDFCRERKTDFESDSSNVRPLSPLQPLLTQRELIDREFRWLIPLGVAHLQHLMEDENTDSRIVDAVLDYAISIPQAAPLSEVDQAVNFDIYRDRSNGFNHFYSSPYELLMTLDAARKARDQIETDQFLRVIEQWRQERLRYEVEVGRTN